MVVSGEQEKLNEREQKFPNGFNRKLKSTTLTEKHTTCVWEEEKKSHIVDV